LAPRSVGSNLSSTILAAYEGEPIPAIRVVFFDFGFTLWDEERAWAAWAQWLDVRPLDFFTVLGSVIERGEHHHRAFETLRPGIDIARERERRKETGHSDAFRPEELYPDVVPCLTELRSAGYRTGLETILRTSPGRLAR
jgi:phosphoglycolate phosphatase-like HAD superfamily hydrolase